MMLEDNGFGKHLESQSVGAVDERELDYEEAELQYNRTVNNKQHKKRKHKHKRREEADTGDKMLEGAGNPDWEDPYQNAIGTKLTQMRVQGTPMLEAGSHSESAVELNKLSSLLQKW